MFVTIIKTVLLLFHFVFVLTSCGIATKQDLKVLRTDIKKAIAEEVDAAHDDQAAQLKAIKEKIPEEQGLVDRVTSWPPWIFFTGEFLIIGGICVINARRLVYLDPAERRTVMMAGQMLKAVVLNMKTKNRNNEDQPDPPDKKPPLHVVK